MKKYVVFTLCFLLVTACKQNGGTKSLQKNEVIDSLTAEITEISKNGVFNGFAVSIVNEDSILYQKGFGFSDVSAQKKYTSSTIQNIASISKTLVGIALLKAQELGKLNLDDPINKFLPFKIYNPTFPDEQITIRHLATHTSGIVDNEFYLSKNYYLKPKQNLSGLALTFDETQVFNSPDSIVSMETLLRNTLLKNGKWLTKET